MQTKGNLRCCEQVVEGDTVRNRGREKEAIDQAKLLSLSIPASLTGVE